MSAVLTIGNLSFSYPDRHVFTGWSADLPPGITGLRGANGCGKSTLLQLLAGALPPLTGQVRVRNIDQQAEPLAYRREVFWCGPDGIAFDHLRPDEYFGFIAGLYPRLSPVALAAHADGLGLGPHRGKRLSALSTGTQRKVALATALAVGTAVVLLDEPFNALDTASATYLRQALATCDHTEQAWLIASHQDLGVATAQEINLASAD